MNARGATLSPESVGGSEWSGISGYHSRNPADSPYGAASPYNRAAATTPPVSTGSLGAMNGPAANGIGRGPNGSPGNPSPPSSIARSSTGTGLYAASDSGQSRKGSILEDALAEHYIALKRFLAASLRDEKGNPRPNRARDKLLRLSPVQFQELSTDVFDELLRRQSSAGQRRSGPRGPDETPPYLLPRNNFHPKRNQARQKLSTLPPPRFRDLATDVFYELERRFPRFTGGDIDRTGSPASSMRGFGRNGPPLGGPGSRPGSRGGPINGGSGPPGRNGPRTYSNLGPSGNDLGRPLPKTFQSNTIVPNKSTMVEDDDDQTVDDHYDQYGSGGRSQRDTQRSTGSIERDKKLIAEFQAEADSLQVKVTNLEGQMQEKDDELSRLRDSERGIITERKEWSKLQASLESRIADAQNLNSSLQDALKRAQNEDIELEKDFSRQLDEARRGPSNASDEWKSRHDELERAHSSVTSELREQQQVTDEVRRQASDFLHEMKLLTDQSHEASEREEKLADRMSQLEGEVQTWKDRYMQAKSQAGSERSSANGFAIEPPNTKKHAREGGFNSSSGLVKNVHVTKFQVAIDELLHTARTREPSAVLEQMKPVVVSVRHITQDISDSPGGQNDASGQRKKLTMRVAATANNLITASKNFSASNGISPVSLLDAAASHLAAAMVELLRAVKVRPAAPGEVGDGDDGTPTPNAPSGYYGGRNGAHEVESVYSTMSSQMGNSAHASRSMNPDPNLMTLPATRHAMTNGRGHSASPAPVNRTRVADEDIEELKIFLEDQTEKLVGSIQALVSSIRAEDPMSSVRTHISDIAFVVGKVVSSTEGTMSQTDLTALQDRGEPILDKLSSCRTRLLKASSESEKIRNPASLKEFSKQLPPLAFEIARETKELVQRVDQLGHGGGHAEESFR